MPEIAYSYRAGLFSKECHYRLEAGNLCWSSGRSEKRITLDQVTEILIYRRYMRGPSSVACKFTWVIQLRTRANQKIVLSPLHRAGFRVREDRTAGYLSFAQRLIAAVRVANPDLSFTSRNHWTTRFGIAASRNAMIAGGALARPVLTLLRHMGPQRAADLSAGFMRAIGPFLRAHRIARANLAAAFPEKSSAEIGQILSGCWDNLGRTCGEYAHLDQLWDHDPTGAVPSRIVIDPADLERFRQLAGDQNGALIFSAHVANWELAAVGAAALGVNSAILFRPPNVPAVARLVSEIRSATMGQLIESTFRAPTKLVRELRRGAHLAMLVDQYYARGVDVIFFGRPTKANPLIARLARLTERPIQGARIIRLSGHRFRAELTPPIEVVREPGGKIDVPATMQVVCSIIERWIREHPDQWLWQHRRWR